MQRKNLFTIFISTGFLLMLGAGIWLSNADPVSAQCGSAASSCKNCHEVQGEMPVNNDGTAWHTSHAFGDFCYICHAGNQQSKDETEAHASMVPPLSDIKASCQQCHPDDLQEKAQVYASVLNIEIGSNSAPTTSSGGSESSVPVENPQTAVSPITTELDYDDPNLVNYIQTYDEAVLGKVPTNWGNVILLVMIGMLVIGGGGFVISNEKLINVTFGDTKKISDEYPSEVVDMLPAISKLNSHSRKSLRKILDNPAKSAKVLALIDEIITNEKEKE
ncbi:MAG TPA: hypothetical protein VJZ78_03825 [Anaerolineales bacterium]|nr:hypothetical protein [Anaerolineales bacterium]